MKISILGAGAMGSIYGAYLSKNNDVTLIDKNEDLVKVINENGIKLHEGDKVSKFKNVKATVNSKELATQDLLIVFVKSIFSEIALEENKNLIGENTILMTLQNGSGHEEILNKFTTEDKIIIGTTEDNGAVLDLGIIRHGGTGKTNIGAVSSNNKIDFNLIKSVLDESGFITEIHDNIQYLIWDKLFVNISLSLVTGILQVPIGYIYKDKYAWQMTLDLLDEALMVAKNMGLNFDRETIIEKVKNVSLNNPNGLTSIYADLKNGRKTEVNTISGSVIKAANKLGIKVPLHEFVVNMVHAIENK